MGATTEPIIAVKNIKKLLSYLMRYENTRDGMLFLMIMNALLRISDALTIKYGDVFDENRQPRGYFTIVESKPKKLRNNRTARKIKLPKTYLAELTAYADDLEMVAEDYLFYSSKHPERAMSRKTAWAVFDRAAKACKIEFLGCHGIRKTGATQMRLNRVPIRVIQKMLGHTTERQTMEYIGMAQEEIDEAIAKMDFSVLKYQREEE